MEEDGQLEAVWAPFCALYLPATVDRFLDPPTVVNDDPEIVADFKLYNVYSQTLEQVQRSPYFIKYLRSTTPCAVNGKRLPRVIAERLAERAVRWDRAMALPPPNYPPMHFVAMIAGVCQLLSKLITILKDLDRNTNSADSVPAEAKAALLPFVARWAGRYRGELGTIFSCTYLFLAGNEIITLAAPHVRRRFKKMQVCALPECNIEENLKLCTKYVLFAFRHFLLL